MEMRRFLDAITPQNLNKTCNDLQKKAKMFSKNKKKHELEPIKEKQFCLPTSPEQIKKETMTPQSKAIKDLHVENRGLKRSISKMLSFSEELLDHHDQLVPEQSALELEYYATVERMRVITNNIAGVVVERERERDNLKKEVNTLQEQFSEQSEKLNQIQEKMASYQPGNVNKREKKAKSKIQSLSEKIEELNEEKNDTWRRTAFV